MITTPSLRRRLPGGWQAWLSHPTAFTAVEVRQLLASDLRDPRGRAVARCAARLNAWLPVEPHFRDCPQHAWQHLSRIVFWTTRGEPIDAIARRIGTLGPAWGTERALDFACVRMADCLNRDPVAYGLAEPGWRAARPARWGGR